MQNLQIPEVIQPDLVVLDIRLAMDILENVITDLADGKIFCRPRKVDLSGIKHCSRIDVSDTLKIHRGTRFRCFCCRVLSLLCRTAAASCLRCFPPESRVVFAALPNIPAAKKQNSHKNEEHDSRTEPGSSIPPFSPLYSLSASMSCHILPDRLYYPAAVMPQAFPVPLASSFV